MPISQRSRATRFGLALSIALGTVAQVAEMLKIVKGDSRTLELQNEFFDRVEKLGRDK